MIVRLKVIKFREDTFCYLSPYLHHSFFWHLVIVTFIYYIIKLPSQSKDLWLYYIKNVCLYYCAIRLSASHRIIEALSSYSKILRIVVGPSLIIVSLSKCSESVPNLILLKYFIDDGCVHPLLVNFSYRWVYQSISLMTNAYTYIRYRSTSPIDQLITCQNAKEERFFYII